MTEGEWHDNIDDAITYSTKVLDILRKERSQLYGTIIHLMKLYDMDSFPMPDLEILADYGKEYFIIFAPDESGKFFVSLMERENGKDKMP